MSAKAKRETRATYVRAAFVAMLFEKELKLNIYLKQQINNEKKRARVGVDFNFEADFLFKHEKENAL